MRYYLWTQQSINYCNWQLGNDSPFSGHFLVLLVLYASFRPIYPMRKQIGKLQLDYLHCLWRACLAAAGSPEHKTK